MSVNLRLTATESTHLRGKKTEISCAHQAFFAEQNMRQTKNKLDK